MKALEFVNVTKRYGNNVVLKDVSFEIDEGEFVGLIGENASGKTTIARIASGQLKPDHGEVLVFNSPPYKDYGVKQRIGFASHNLLLYPELTAYENLEFYGKLYDVKNFEIKINELFEFLGLSRKKDERVKNLSRGFRQRVAIARALINDPDLLILDEVTTGLDPTIREVVLDYLTEINKMKKTILFITHHLDEVKNCDRMLEVKGGKVFAQSL